MKLQLIRFLGLYFWPLVLAIALAAFVYRQFVPMRPTEPNIYEINLAGKSREATMQLVGSAMAFAQFCPLEINIGALAGYFQAAGIPGDAYGPNGRYRVEWEAGQIIVLNHRISGISDTSLCAEADRRFTENGSDLPNLLE